MRSALSENQRVVISGAGPIASVGIGREDFLKGLREGRVGIGASERLTDTAGFAEVAECWDFAVEDYLISKKTYLDRCSELALAACALAFADAGLVWSELDGDRIGLCLGTAYGCLEAMSNHSARVQAKGLRFGSPMIFTHAMANSPTALVAIEYGIHGPAGTFCAGSISAACALEFAFRRVRAGDADYVLAGGCEALSVALLSGLAGPDRLEPDFVPGEGGCILMLERMDTAAARGAEMLAEVASVGLAVATEAKPDAALDAACRQADLTDKPPVFAPPAYGHTFGASMALDICAAIAGLDSYASGDCVAVMGRSSLTDIHSSAAAIIIRRVT